MLGLALGRRRGEVSGAAAEVLVTALERTVRLQTIRVFTPGLAGSKHDAGAVLELYIRHWRIRVAEQRLRRFAYHALDSCTMDAESC